MTAVDRLAALEQARRDAHALRYGIADTGTIYSCACGEFEDAADPTDEDHRRVYEAHAAHIAASAPLDAVASDVCACGDDITDHGLNFGCIYCGNCTEFAARIRFTTIDAALGVDSGQQT